MLLSALSALVIPRQSSAVRPNLQILFAPVSRPAAGAAAWAEKKFSEPAKVDTRPNADIATENDALRMQVANLTSQLNALKELNADREQLGDVRPLCTPVTVVGGDTGVRQSLALASTKIDAIQPGMAVLHSGGIAGRIENVGALGAAARLITDRDFRLTGSFGRFRKIDAGRFEFVRIATPRPLLVGAGNGRIVIKSLTMKDVQAAGLAENDWVVLDDSDWPLNLQGYRVGRIVGKIEPGADAPLFAEIHVAPTTDLTGLREVMVLTK